MKYAKPIIGLDVGAHVVCTAKYGIKSNAFQPPDTRGVMRQRNVLSIPRRFGWLVGWRDIMVRWSMVYGYDPHVDTVFAQDKAALVVFWPTHRPVLIPSNFIHAANEAEWEPTYPTAPWSDKDRAYLREIMADMPRNERGQWIKEKHALDQQAERPPGDCPSSSAL